MQNKSTFFGIILSLIILALIFGGVVLYRQNQILAELRAKINPSANGSVNNFSSAAVDPETAKKEDREIFINSEKFIVGKIKEIKNNALIVEAQVLDPKTLLAVDPQKPMTITAISKTYQVSVDKNTKFPSGLKFSDLKVGDLVAVTADKSVLNTESFVAVKIEKVDINFSSN